MDKKVYCKNCIHFNDYYLFSETCLKVIGIVDRPEGRKKIRIKNYYKQNKDNHCKFYLQKTIWNRIKDLFIDL